MGRKKIEIRKIANDKKRSRLINRVPCKTTLVKRKAGLLKKAMELSILCECEIAVLVLDANGDMTQYASSNVDALYTKFAANPHQVRTLTNSDYHDFEQKEEEKSPLKTPAPTPATPQPTLKAPIPPYRAGQPVYSYFVTPGSNFAFLAPHPLTGATPLQSLNNVNINNATISSAAMNNTAQQIYAVPTALGAMPGLTALNAGSVAAQNTGNATNNNNTANTANNNVASSNTATNSNTNATAVNESGTMTGAGGNMSPDNAPLTTGQTPPLISLSTSPVLSPGSVKYSPKEFLNFTEDDTGTGLTPPLMLASPTSIGSASSPLGMDHVFALPKSKKRKLDEISSPTEDPNRGFGEENANMMTSHIIPLTTNHVTKQQQQDDTIMTTLSSALGASQGTGSAITPVFALTTSVPNQAMSGEEDEPSNSTASNNTPHSALTSSGPKKKDLKITIPSHGLFVAPYPVMLAQPSHESGDGGDTSKSGNYVNVMPATGPATPGGPLLMPPMTPHLVTPLGANFEFPQFFLPQSPFMQSPLMTPTFAPFYSFMPSTPKI